MTEPTIDGTRLDATLEWVSHKVHCVDPCDRVLYENILASLERLKSLDAQPEPVEPDDLWASYWDTDNQLMSERAFKEAVSELQSALQRAQEELKSANKAITWQINETSLADQRAEKAEALAEQFRKDAERLLDTLKWLDSIGGLGIEAHRRIRAAIDSARAE
jgi:hypothetical protein